jgi:hypothetical protein
MVLPERLDRCLGQREGPPRLGRLSVAALAHRTPYGHGRRDGPYRGWISVQIDVIPAKFPGLLSSDADCEAQHDVGVQPRLPGRFEQRKRLVEGKRPARPTDLALGRVDQGGHVPADQVVRLGAPDRPR